jgi:hypothetical protein
MAERREEKSAYASLFRACTGIYKYERELSLNLAPLESATDADIVGVGLAADDKCRVLSRMGLSEGLALGPPFVAVLGVPVGHHPVFLVIGVPVLLPQFKSLQSRLMLHFTLTSE